MKTLAAVAALLFSTGAYAAAPEDSRLCQRVPTPSFCEQDQHAPPATKSAPKATPKAAPLPGGGRYLYDKGKAPPKPRPMPRRRYEENPLFLLPSFFGLLAAKTYDRVEGGVAMAYSAVAKPVGLHGNPVERVVSKVYNGTKTTIGLGTAAAFDGVNALVPDR